MRITSSVAKSLLRLSKNTVDLVTLMQSVFFPIRPVRMSLGIDPNYFLSKYFESIFEMKCVLIVNYEFNHDVEMTSFRFDCIIKKYS